MTEILEPVEGELVAYAPPVPPPATLFQTNDPAAVVEAATEAARPLAEVVRKQGLVVKIGQGEHVKVEGWTLLGSMLGVFPVCVWTRQMENGWEARVEARTRNGEIVGAAEAECLRSEKTWASRDDYALRSMAQTRATSKALRQPLGFVMQMAGFEATPAEEMPSANRARTPDVDYGLEADVGELIGLSSRLGVEEVARATIEMHRQEPDFAKWVQAQLKHARVAVAVREADSDG